MRKPHVALLVGLILVFAWSGWQPYDRFTWWLETFPGLAGIILLLSIYRRFQFTTLCYTLIALHICILCIGGHYTYAREPLFGWLQTTFDWWAAALSGDASVSFLATQGDVWDTQKDMFLALIGATCALLFLSRLHDRALARLSKPTP